MRSSSTSLGYGARKYRNRIVLAVSQNCLCQLNPSNPTDDESEVSRWMKYKNNSSFSFSGSRTPAKVSSKGSVLVIEQCCLAQHRPSSQWIVTNWIKTSTLYKQRQELKKLWTDREHLVPTVQRLEMQRCFFKSMFKFKRSFYAEGSSSTGQDAQLCSESFIDCSLFDLPKSPWTLQKELDILCVGVLAKGMCHISRKQWFRAVMTQLVWIRGAV